MELKFENFLDIPGNSEEFPVCSENFKQVHIQKISCLDKKKFNIKRFLNTSAKTGIVSTKIMKTSKGISQENQILTGKSLMVEGKVIQNLEYISKDAYQHVNITDFYIPFSTFIILGKEFDDHSKFKVTPYIENLHIRQISERKVFQSILLTLDVTAF